MILVQLEVPLDAVREAITLAERAGRKVVLDPALAQPLKDEMLAMADVVKPNAPEAKTLTGIDVRGWRSAERATRALLGARRRLRHRPGRQRRERLRLP